MRGNESGVAGTQHRKVAMVPALPHFLLPEGIEAFDFCLEPGLARRGAHRGDAKTEAKTNEPATVLRMAMGALANRCAAELRITGPAHCPPVSRQGFQGARRGGSR